MARSSRLDAGVASINASSIVSSASTLLTVQHETRNDHASEKSLDFHFHELAAAIRAELAPEGMLESLLVDRAVLASWALHLANRAESAAIDKAARRRGTSSTRPARGQAVAELRREGLEAQQALEKATTLLQTLRDRRQARWGHPICSNAPASGAERGADRRPSDFDVDSDQGDDFPIISRGRFVDADQDDEGLTDDPSSSADVDNESWQARLIYDFNVSETSPVVKGTWVTVSHVVSLIVDGWTWGDILRTHPELTEEDIRVCLAYTIAQDNGEA
jgi:uncharacterized protein (DUF433 family)